MRRADRLFGIIQRLRRRHVVTARALAEQFKVSERTIYRDIRDLIASKVPIEGAAGMGYSLRGGYVLPPLMFDESELEAIVFGARIVQSWSDSEMARSAEAALSKIENVLPPHLARLLADRSLWAPSTSRQMPLAFDLVELRVEAQHLQLDWRSRDVAHRLFRRRAARKFSNGRVLSTCSGPSHARRATITPH